MYDKIIFSGKVKAQIILLHEESNILSRMA